MKEIYYIGVFISIASAIVGLLNFFTSGKNLDTNSGRNKFRAIVAIVFIISTAVTIATYDKEKSNSIPSATERQSIVNEVKTGNYIANGSKDRRIYFHNSPDPATRRDANICTQEAVFVEKIQNDFGYIEFTNSRGQSSYGWVEMKYLVRKP